MTYTNIYRRQDWRPMLSEMVPGENYSEARLLSLINADRDTDHFGAQDLRNIIQTADWRLVQTVDQQRRVYRLSIKYLKSF